MCTRRITNGRTSFSHLLYISWLNLYACHFGYNVAINPADLTPPPSPFPASCEPVTLPMCLHDDVTWNKTRMPNLLGHVSQLHDALQMSQEWTAHLSLGCHDDLRVFLCSVYVPRCTANGSALPRWVNVRDTLLASVTLYSRPWWWLRYQDRR